MITKIKINMKIIQFTLLLLGFSLALLQAAPTGDSENQNKPTTTPEPEEHRRSHSIAASVANF